MTQIMKNGLSNIISNLQKDTVSLFISKVIEEVDFDQENNIWLETIYSEKNNEYCFDIFMKKCSDNSFNISINEFCFNSESFERLSSEAITELELFIYDDVEDY